LRSYLNRYFPSLLIVCLGTLHAAGADGPDAVVQNYWAASAGQERALHGASMEVDIQASLPKLKKQGHLQALRRISRLGRVSYEALRFEGDNSVKKHVIARYLAAEAEAQADGAPSLAVTPANYKFKYNGPLQDGDRKVEVFRVTPRRKMVGMFKGEIWIDAATFLCVRESGRLVKVPSLFLKKVEFVKEFEIQGGVSVPRQIHSTVETRLVGPAVLTVDFRNISLAENPKRASLIETCCE